MNQERRIFLPKAPKVKINEKTKIRTTIRLITKMRESWRCTNSCVPYFAMSSCTIFVKGAVIQLMVKSMIKIVIIAGRKIASPDKKVFFILTRFSYRVARFSKAFWSNHSARYNIFNSLFGLEI